ncbi:MAG: hypothetical protein K6E11_00620 [Bacilli bacterium]|nr:hypothetical protein [Bacilli bacterium]
MKQQAAQLKQRLKEVTQLPKEHQQAKLVSKTSLVLALLMVNSIMMAKSIVSM